MKNNKQILRAIIYFLIAVIFNLIFFIVGGTSHTSAEWVAYVWTYVAILVSFGAPLLCIKYKRTPENLVTIYLFAWLYSIGITVFNALVMLLNIKSVKIVILINGVVFLVYLIQLIFNMRVNYDIEKNEETIDSERQFVHDVSNKIRMCMQMVDDLTTKKSLEKAYDTVRTSPLHTNPQVMNYEIEVVRLVADLEMSTDSGDYETAKEIAGKIVINTNKRNAMLR